MRIAVLSWNRRKIGGVESYLAGVIPELQRLGHSLAFWSEVNQPAVREEIPLPDGTPSWSVSELGIEASVQALRNWYPDVIFANGLHDPTLERRTLTIAPAAFFAHSYYGTCISGSKTFKFPVITPCNRRFGWRCLLHYYPHNCGGWSPLTMLRAYHVQAERLKILRSYKAILTLSRHIRCEYRKHGLDAECIYDLSHLGSESQQNVLQTEARPHGKRKDGPPDPWRLVFVGRMDLLKGGKVFLDALPKVRECVRRPIRVTFCGDGPSRPEWEQRALDIQNQCRAEIKFVGWLDGSQLRVVMANCDLLVMPSLWPEPMGLVGQEAISYGIPVVAFAVGGIPEWLVDGINGRLAPGNPPSAAGLAKAIIQCLADPVEYVRLRQNTFNASVEIPFADQARALSFVFERLTSSTTVKVKATLDAYQAIV